MVFRIQCLLFFSFLFVCSCSKDLRKHAIKGRVLIPSTNQPLGHRYVVIKYYTPSGGMGFSLLNSEVGSSFTDADGNFEIYFHPKEYQLQEGEFIVDAEYQNIIKNIAKVPFCELKEKRIVTLGTIYIQ